MSNYLVYLPCCCALIAILIVAACMRSSQISRMEERRDQ